MTKIEVLNKLKEEGYTAVFSQEGVPTLLIPKEQDIRETAEQIREVFKACGYDQSFAVKHSSAKAEKEIIDNEVVDAVDELEESKNDNEQDARSIA